MSSISDQTMLRVWILIAGVVLVAAIMFFGRPRRPGQGRRVARGEGGRVEPTLGEQLQAELATDDAPAEPSQESLDLQPRGGAATDELGKRTTEEFDKIVTLYLAARAGQLLHGPDIVVAAERPGSTTATWACSIGSSRGIPSAGRSSVSPTS